MSIANCCQDLPEPHQAVKDEATIVLVLTYFDAFTNTHECLVVLTKSEAEPCFVKRWLVNLGSPTDKFQGSCFRVEFFNLLSHVVIEVAMWVADSLLTISTKSLQVCSKQKLLMRVLIDKNIGWDIFKVLSNLIDAFVRWLALYWKQLVLSPCFSMHCWLIVLVGTTFYESLKRYYKLVCLTKHHLLIGEITLSKEILENTDSQLVVFRKLAKRLRGAAHKQRVYSI